MMSAADRPGGPARRRLGRGGGDAGRGRGQFRVGPGGKRLTHARVQLVLV